MPNKEYPTPPLRASRPSFDKLEDMINVSMMADGRDYKTARRKVRASPIPPFPCFLTSD